MDLKNVDEYGKLMDKMQIAYTNVIYFMEDEMYRRKVYLEYLDDVALRKVMSILKANGRLPVGELAKKAAISPKCIHRPLKKLEERGLIERSRDENNKKTLYINLSHTGKEQLEMHSKNSRDIMLNIFEQALSEEEQLDMIFCTERLLTYFSKCGKCAERDAPVSPKQVHFSFDLTNHVNTSKRTKYSELGPPKNQ